MRAVPESKPPVPPFTLDSAKQKIQAAEDAWNSRDPARVSMAYTLDTEWRNRNENWEFAPNGLMAKRYASINDMRIAEAERKQRWERKA